MLHDAYRDGLIAAWKAVDAIIKRGELATPWQNEQRNGMVLACNEIMKLIGLVDRLRDAASAEGGTK